MHLLFATFFRSCHITWRHEKSMYSSTKKSTLLLCNWIHGLLLRCTVGLILQLRLWNKIWPDNDFLTYRGFVITMMKFIISSTETAPSWFVSAKRKIFAGIPRLDKILWNVSGRTGSSMQIKYAMASNNSTISVFSSVESSCSSLWFLEKEKTLDINPKWKVYLIEKIE